MKIITALNKIPIHEGVDYLKEYYGLTGSSYPDNKPRYSGSYFELLDMDITEQHPHRITGSDLYALTTLDIEVPRRAGIGILATEQAEITQLLEQIPDVKLQDLSRSEFLEHLGPDSPAARLWDLLRRNGTTTGKWGIGPTTASKIMARKRPKLIPIQDTVVDEVVGRRRGENAWELWWTALSASDEALAYADKLTKHLEDRHDDIRKLSTLRKLDIVLWMFGRRQRLNASA